MKKLLLVLFVLISSCYLFAQPNNGGMENWVSLGTSDEEPTDWNSFMNASGTWSGTAAQQIKRSPNVRAGAPGPYCAVIWARSVLGVVANGNMTTGQVNMGSTTPTNANNYNVTHTANANYSETVTGFPDSIVFWTRFKPVAGADIARMRAVVHDTYDYRDPSGSDANSPNHVVGNATLNFPTTANLWVRKSVPFTFTGPIAAANSTHILITFTTNQTPGGGTAGDSLYIDDIGLVYNPVLTTGSISPLIYYVSSTTGASVTVPYTVSGTVNAGNIFTAQLSNSAGSFAAPTNIGTLASTTSGSISATIPAGTANGSGYRIRTMGSNYPLTGTNNGADIQIILVANSIAPLAPQTLVTNTNGSTLTVTESAGVVSREWKYATVPGGPYNSFAPAETATTYVPNFSSAGTYYVICETTYPGGLVVTSNEVQINVVGNSVAPSGSQSILVSVNGTALNVTETPAGSSREWKFATTPGGPYSSFAPTETGLSYVPNFISAGVYYIVCVSTISTIECTSNEVTINVGNATLSTGIITGSPFEFSANAPNANVSVPYVVSGSLNPGNVFTAQLSDAGGSFASATNIGSLNSITNGTISATIPNTTLDGTGYRIRVISSDPIILGSDNGTDLIVDQFDNSINPTTTQNIVYNTNGIPVNVTESQTSTREWKYSTVSGGPYTVFVPAETGASYTPNFPAPGTYYVVAVSENMYTDTVTSAEVQINVLNGTTLNTSTVPTSTFYLSPNAVVTENISFTSDIIFNASNNFIAEMSDAAGSFASPTIIGTVASSSIVPVPVQIPNISPNGTGYRIRVRSDDPPAVGTDNGIDLSVVQFENSIAPIDTQYIAVATNGNVLNVTSTHPTGVSHEWKYKVGLAPYVSFAPTETGTSYTPNFGTIDGYYIKCYSVNMWDDTIQSSAVVIYVTTSGLEDEPTGEVQTSWQNNQLWINLTNANVQDPVLMVFNMTGQVVYTQKILAGTNHMIPMDISSGVYLVRVMDEKHNLTGRFVKP